MSDDIEALVAELHRLDAEATPGPWRAGACETDRVFVRWRGTITGGDERVLLRMNANSEEFPAAADARLIAAMRNALPALLAEVERLEQGCRLTAAACDQAREQRDQLGVEVERLRLEEDQAKAGRRGAEAELRAVRQAWQEQRAALEAEVERLKAAHHDAVGDKLAAEGEVTDLQKRVERGQRVEAAAKVLRARIDRHRGVFGITLRSLGEGNIVDTIDAACADLDAALGGSDG